ncbi:hypothetical protein Ciccas_001265 [Cichlidogyrus casuarinus]|uniref:Uncharacterized protein n=1 Tax=Cichlidogyrus casuarinus TaxID=1844966 RepID=A0ABD2QLP1_9PLAT
MKRSTLGSGMTSKYRNYATGWWEGAYRSGPPSTMSIRLSPLDHPVAALDQDLYLDRPTSSMSNIYQTQPYLASVARGEAPQLEVCKRKTLSLHSVRDPSEYHPMV